MTRNRTLFALAATLAFSASAAAEEIKARLIGYQEVPSVASDAVGEFRGHIGHDGQSIEYELTFGGLQGTVQQSHIHIAQAGVNGSVVIWLCQTQTTPAPASVAGITPFCPQEGTVTGHITSANVIAGSTASQQLKAGDLDRVIDAMRSGVAYVNIHTLPLSPGGEIRGQIKASDKGGRE